MNTKTIAAEAPMALFMVADVRGCRKAVKARESADSAELAA
ncbi:hypothetical protein OZX62_00660 [Bifidobacterium sp. ESL0690]|nr:hypothetical protein [Bifidobacterium sp. ESL0690]WEV46848.1 hypothetical protein OZX62_00660 [Bifidobacterium sp. ESL0690]